MPPLNENHRLLLQMLSFRECLARVGLLSHFSKLLTTEKREATLGDTENIRPESCCLRAHPAVQLARFRDLATSNLSTITHLQVQHQLVPLFCEIRLAGAVPASSALEFQLSFRRQLRVSIQLLGAVRQYLASSFSVSSTLIVGCTIALHVSHVSAS